jgi:hypothetical protein
MTTSIAEDSDDADNSPQPRQKNPLDFSNAPLQSLRISQNSSFPQHSSQLTSLSQNIPYNFDFDFRSSGSGFGDAARLR